MRKLVLLICVAMALAGGARAQQVAQIDIAGGGSTLFSTKSISSSAAFIPPALSGGVYPSLSADVLLDNHFGFNAEGTFRYHEGIYAGFQKFRPVFYDVNGLYTRTVSPKIRFDALAGLGGESLIFYNSYAPCPASGTCRPQLSGTHLVLHAEAEVRYYPWRLRHLFLRPEAHFYRIIDNTEFNSGNILRLGASIGYSFAR